MTTREELIRRLEGGEVGREIDAEIGLLFPESYTGDYGEPMISLDVGRVTTSLDSALALVERVRPDDHLMMSFMRDDRGPHIMAVFNPMSGGRSATAPTPAAALVCALLKAEG